MRLVAAELLKMRRRTMTWVLPAVMLIVMALVFLVIGSLTAGLFTQIGSGPLAGMDVPFWVVSAVVGDFVFGLGSLLVMIYTGAIVGGDYTWGVLRNAFARGESRVRYAAGKAVALAVLIALGALICFVAGTLMVLTATWTVRFDLGNPLTADSLGQMGGALVLGTAVLFERAAIAFAVAVLMRSQVAAIVVGVVLYIAEPLIAGVASVISAIGQFGAGGVEGVHWSQFLPFTIGGNVLVEGRASLPALAGLGGSSFVSNIPLVQSVPVLIAYGVIALAVGAFVMHRQEIIN